MKPYAHEAIAKKYNATFSMEIPEDDTAIITDWVSDPVVDVPDRAAIDQAITEYEASQEYIRPNFNVGLFQADLAAILPTLSNFNLRWEFAGLNAYAASGEFENLAGYMSMLVSGGAALQSDADAVIALLTKQGIVIQ